MLKSFFASATLIPSYFPQPPGPVSSSPPPWSDGTMSCLAKYQSEYLAKADVLCLISAGVCRVSMWAKLITSRSFYVCWQYSSRCFVLCRNQKERSWRCWSQEGNSLRVHFMCFMIKGRVWSVRLFATGGLAWRKSIVQTEYQSISVFPCVQFICIS